MKFKRNDICSFLGDQLIDSQCIAEKNVTYESVVFDSREAVPGIIFMAMDGSRSVGVLYVRDAINKGATCIIVNESYKNEISSITEEFRDQVDFLFVKDTLYSFGLLGKLAREQFSGPVIGIIGSVGKTTTKNMLRELGGGEPNAHASRGSFNNQTGVPLTLCAIGEQANRAIVELGESHFGDLTYIVEISKPTHLVITNVAEAHMEFLSDLQGVAKTMNEAVVLMDSDGVIFLPSDIEHKEIVLKDSKARTVFIDVSESRDQDKDLAQISEVIERSDLTHDFVLSYGGSTVQMHCPLVGLHFVIDAALATAVSLEIGDDPKSLNSLLENVKPQGHRMKIIQSDSLTIIDDCYNANPASMKASMSAVKAMAEKENARSVFFMGPMRELGDNSDNYHNEVGKFAQQIGIDVLVCVDGATKSVVDSNVHSNAYYFESVAAAVSGLDEIVKAGDFVGVKASRGPDPVQPAMVPIVEKLEDLKYTQAN